MEFNIKKASLLIISLIFLIGALQNTQYITLENFLSTQTYIKLAIFFAFLSLSVGVFSIINIDADYLNFFYLLPVFFFLLSAPLYLDMPFWSLKFLFFLFLIFPYATTYTKFLRTDQIYLKIPIFSFFISINTILGLVLAGIISLNFFTQADLSKENTTVKTYVKKVVDIAGEKALKIGSDEEELDINSVDTEIVKNKEVLKDLIKKYGINFQSNPAIALLNTSNAPTLDKIKAKALESTKNKMIEEAFLYIESFKIPIKIFLSLTLFGYLSFAFKLLSSITTILNYAFFNLLMTAGFLFKEVESKEVIRYTFKGAKPNQDEIQSSP